MNNKKQLDFQTIAVDFDGTLCYSKWPELGQPNQALIEYLQEWKRNAVTAQRMVYPLNGDHVGFSMVNSKPST